MTLVRVRARAGASREAVEEIRGGYRISVREKAEGGRANERIKEVLARTLGVPVAKVRLIKGKTEPSKIFRVS